ncbi:MAG TPA: sigma-54 dependent transcriptional regulator [Phycisphaerales bacterium]|nr:sigma-54 dependent transcriptional regulator [Phycisphaerales bacterium]
MSDRRKRVLIVDDDPIASESLGEFVHELGHDVVTASNGRDALARLEQAESSAERIGAEPDAAGRDDGAFSVVVCDVSMPVMNGLEFLKACRKRFPAVAVIMLTGYGAIESAVEAVRLGACEYLTKPVVDQELRMAMQRAFREHALLEENRNLKARLDDAVGLKNIVGHDPRMTRIFELVQAVAPSKTTVLMTGESGTGKSLIAHAIHQLSPRSSRPFVQLSCGSIPETLLESELFGHVKGAFTGAHADKAGRFLVADTGTIFLDEINSASPAMQLKLLRVLQERKFEPVGSSQTHEVDVRVVLATNRPLEDLVRSGEFRQDLYYRINVVQVELPALRERRSDIPLLAQHFLAKHSANLGRHIAGFSPDALATLEHYAFPGNVRELENIIERAAVLCRGATIQRDDLPEAVVNNTTGHLLPAHVRERLGLRLSEPGAVSSPAGHPSLSLFGADAAAGAYVPMSLEEALKEPERRILLRALKANAWNRQKTADDLQINRTTLYKKMRLLGIESDERLAG